MQTPRLTPYLKYRAPLLTLMRLLSGWVFLPPSGESEMMWRKRLYGKSSAMIKLFVAQVIDRHLPLSFTMAIP
ncbi:unnamed protein product [Soboliphyme baturini]|uniref:Secreted protein n=1 Tax=Soboliphyme baturini TaxID=241478 RepID=A0A183IYT8_9BILA|nr:unnamed protein product [Soboliphyme baturini]